MKLKHHQQKLLRKVDFLSWKGDNTLREAAVMRRYHVTGREDYVKYSRLVGQVTAFVAKLKALKPDSEQRADLAGQYYGSSTPWVWWIRSRRSRRPRRSRCRVFVEGACPWSWCG